MYGRKVSALQDKIDLSLRRLEKAADCLNDSRNLIRSGGYKSSANRSYYAVFHAIRAVLAFNDFDSKKHSGVISEFRKLYIKTGVFDDEISKIIGRQFDLRSLSDYDDFFDISKENAENAFREAEFVLSEIKKYLSVIFSAE